MIFSANALAKAYFREDAGRSLTRARTWSRDRPMAPFDIVPTWSCSSCAGVADRLWPMDSRAVVSPYSSTPCGRKCSSRRANQANMYMRTIHKLRTCSTIFHLSEKMFSLSRSSSPLSASERLGLFNSIPTSIIPPKEEPPLLLPPLPFPTRSARIEAPKSNLWTNSVTGLDRNSSLTSISKRGTKFSFSPREVSLPPTTSSAHTIHGSRDARWRTRSSGRGG
ncbi:hypothetical protein Mapa_000288 [Marchantia paleacea]|nr:hypothetical protein Mapa_000288 [Marchantia paleacea]